MPLNILDMVCTIICLEQKFEKISKSNRPSVHEVKKSRRQRLQYVSYESKPVTHKPQTQEFPPEYFQDAELPDDSMNINEIGKMFDIRVNDDPQKTLEEPEEEYECPDNHYGCTNTSSSSK
ncbi:unnamed protein product [Eruca vesicaria subsp. sativa]|uniref:Uncharacterized protein n=1 Tax=Eruca vesicaria subsp. sativa TaxID=29727 RepID=A0ABC8LB10_ERUVS|nr:unnamed protein product [Eruca vesicaria subsp. sativa]